MNTTHVATIIAKWPDTKSFANDLGLKDQSHARVMKARGIPKRYWPTVVKAAEARGIPVDETALLRAHEGTRQ